MNVPEEHIKKDLKRFKSMKNALEELIKDDESALKKTAGKKIKLPNGREFELPRGFKKMTPEQKDAWIERVSAHSNEMATNYAIAASIPAFGLGLTPVIGPPIGATLMGAAYGAGKLHDIMSSQNTRKELEEAIDKVAAIKKGQLHRDLGIPEDQPIPTEVLHKALSTASPETAKRIRFALMFRKKK